MKPITTLTGKGGTQTSSVARLVYQRAWRLLEFCPRMWPRGGINPHKLGA